MQHICPFFLTGAAVATERREAVENERQTCFSSANYSILEYQGSSFQLIDSAWPDVVGVLLACAWCRVEVRSSLLFVAFRRPALRVGSKMMKLKGTRYLP